MTSPRQAAEEPADPLGQKENQYYEQDAEDEERLRERHAEYGWEALHAGGVGESHQAKVQIFIDDPANHGSPQRADPT